MSPFSTIDVTVEMPFDVVGSVFVPLVAVMVGAIASVLLARWQTNHAADLARQEREAAAIQAAQDREASRALFEEQQAAAHDAADREREDAIRDQRTQAARDVVRALAQYEYMMRNDVSASASAHADVLTSLAVLRVRLGSGDDSAIVNFSEAILGEISLLPAAESRANALRWLWKLVVEWIKGNVSVNDLIPQMPDTWDPVPGIARVGDWRKYIPLEKQLPHPHAPVRPQD